MKLKIEASGASRATERNKSFSEEEEVVTQIMGGKGEGMCVNKGDLVLQIQSLSGNENGAEQPTIEQMTVWA